MQSSYTWTTAEGKKLNISDMETGHIKNCMRIMRKRNFCFKKEFGFMDEHGCDYHQEYVDERHVYEAMRLELAIRKVEVIRCNKKN